MSLKGSITFFLWPLVNILFETRNWDLIRNKITEAKISDALSVLKYEINGKKVSVLRPLGDGGYSDVYEVYDKARPAASIVERGERRCWNALHIICT